MNTVFRAVARQVVKLWAYELVTISVNCGLRFPLALEPYQFDEKDHEGIHQRTFVKDSDKVANAEKVKRIDIKPHRVRHCHNFCNRDIGGLGDLDLPCYDLKLKVLNFQLHFPEYRSKHNGPRLWYHINLPSDEAELLLETKTSGRLS